MKSRLIPAIIIVFVLILSSFAVLLSTHSTQFPGQKAASFAGSSFTGNITIEPNGSLSVNGAPIQQQGNHYSITGNITGQLTVLHNGTILNGNDHLLLDSSSAIDGVLTVMNVENISVSNLSISGPGSFVDVFVNDSSNIALNHLNVSDSFFGIYVLNYSKDVNISNSRINYTFIDMVMGALMDPFSSAQPVPSRTSADLMAYNDSISSISSGYIGVIIGARDSGVVDSTFVMDNITIAAGTLANGTIFSGNSFSLYGFEAAIFSFPAPGEGNLSGLNVLDNFISGTVTSPQDMIIAVSNTTGVVSGNSIKLNADNGYLTGISYLNAQDGTISNNSVTITNAIGTLADPTYGIKFNGNSTSITDNRVSISGKYSVGIGPMLNDLLHVPVSNHDNLSSNYVNITGTGGFGIALNGNYSHVEGNSIIMNTTQTNATGIGIDGLNDSISMNAINMTYNTVFFANATGIGDIGQFPHLLGNLTVYENSITLYQRGPQTSGIFFYDQKARNINIESNDMLMVQESSNFTYFNGIFVIAHSGVDVILNTVNESVSTLSKIGSAGVVIVANDTLISGNVLTAYESVGIATGSLYSTSNYSILNNTIYHPAYAIWPTDSSNIAIVGNYIYAKGNISLTLDEVNGLWFYHNDIYGSSPGTVNFLGGNSSDYHFNSTYPEGGNYWSNAIGVDQKSGPGQNQPGSDGIMDTSFTASYGVVDYYPLMKPWTRPQAVFHESGLLKDAEWSVTFNGRTETSSQNTISFNIVNGTYQSYTFSISSVKGYKGGESGTLDYTGSTLTTASTYVPYHTIDFVETGLPSGTKWSVDLNGTSYSTTTNASISFALLNGTNVNYTIGGTAEYYPSLGSGNITSLISNQTIDVSYIHWAYLSGSILPANATVILNGVTQNVAGGSFNETIKAGTYELIVKDGGYTTFYDNFTVSPNQTEHVDVSLNEISSGLPVQDYYYIGGGLGAAVLSGVAVTIMRKRSKP